MCAAFPRSEYYQRVRLPPPRLPPSGRSLRLAYSINPIKTAVDLPGPSTRPSPSMPRSQTPPGSPAPSPLADAYSCLPRLQPCRPPDFMVTRLDRFLCSTARTSPCLRLAHVVTSMSPRLGSRWVASPCRSGNCTRWTRQICPGALKKRYTSRFRPSRDQSSQVISLS